MTAPVNRLLLLEILSSVLSRPRYTAQCRSLVLRLQDTAAESSWMTLLSAITAEWALRSLFSFENFSLPGSQGPQRLGTGTM